MWSLGAHMDNKILEDMERIPGESESSGSLFGQ